MNHQEKIQMLDEVQEIRSLIMKLDKPAGTGAVTLSAGGGGGGAISRGKRVLDLF
jgi:hypothetical protein